jgi:hypothetical protein
MSLLFSIELPIIYVLVSEKVALGLIEGFFNFDWFGSWSGDNNFLLALDGCGF